MLNKLNIIQYEQMAALSDDDIANVEEALKLDGVFERTFSPAPGRLRACGCTSNGPRSMRPLAPPSRPRWATQSS